MLDNFSYTEIVLLVGLALLIPLNFSASDRQKKIIFICAGMFLAYFSWGFWNMGFRHFSIVAVVLSSVSLLSLLLPKQLLKRFLMSWLGVLLILSIFLFDSMDVDFHENINVLRPIKFKVETTHFWGGFSILSVVLIVLVWKKFSQWWGSMLSGLIMILWLLSFYTGSVSYWEFEKYKLYWGFGVDAVNFMGETRLFNAAENGDLEVAKSLLILGANPNFVIKPLYTDMAHSEGSPITPMEAAVGNNQYDLFMLLVENGGDINLVSQTGSHLIHHASIPRVTDLRILKFLLDNGADINAKTPKGARPLNGAMKTQDPKNYIDNYDQIKFIIDHGASIDHLYKDRPPIWHAIVSSNVGAVKALVEAGADHSYVGEQGRTGVEWIINGKLNELAGPEYFSNHPKQDVAIKYHNLKAVRYQAIIDFLATYEASENGSPH